MLNWYINLYINHEPVDDIKIDKDMATFIDSTYEKIELPAWYVKLTKLQNGWYYFAEFKVCKGINIELIGKEE